MSICGNVWTFSATKGENCTNGESDSIGIWYWAEMIEEFPTRLIRMIGVGIKKILFDILKIDFNFTSMHRPESISSTEK